MNGNLSLSYFCTCYVPIENSISIYIYTKHLLCNPFLNREISEFDSTIKNVVVRDFLANDENSQLEEDLRLTIEQQSQQDNTLEKLVILQECELITLMTKVKGRIEVNQTLFTFIDLSPPAEDGSKHDFR